MGPSGVLALASILEPFKRVFPDHLEHLVSGLRADRHEPPHQALVDEGAQRLNGVHSGLAAEGFGRVEGEPAPQDTQAAKASLLRGAEKPVAPIDRLAERLMS